MKNIRIPFILLCSIFAFILTSCSSFNLKQKKEISIDLWEAYDQYFKVAKYVDLSHVISPSMPVWEGFGPAMFGPAMNPLTGRVYTYKDDGFESTRYVFPTEQLGTHIDAPSHWAPDYPAIDEIPATFVIRPLVVISIVDKVLKNPNYHLQVEDILEWEKTNGKIPEGSVVFIRSDWSKAWPSPILAKERLFPGIRLEALKFLHIERKILLHGHEPLDTDSTLTMEGESWLMKNGYAQIEVLTNLNKVPEKGALVIIGFPKFQGGTGSFARVIAVCPHDWPQGESVDRLRESPLPRMDKLIMWDFQQGVRVRK